MEAILVDADGMVTEGASTSVWIVDAQGVLRTRALSERILPGCTRAAVIEELAGTGITLEDRPFALEELRGAREIFVTSATTFVKPIVRLDGTVIGDGTPGPIATRLFSLIADRMGGRRNS
jgi:D-alanine transaminase